MNQTDTISARRTAIDSAMSVIEGLWPSCVKDREVKRRLFEKLSHIHDKGLLKKTIDSLADTQDKRPDNIIAAVLHHYKIIAGPQAEPTDKNEHRQLTEYRPKELGPMGRWFYDVFVPAITGGAKGDGVKRLFPKIDHTAVAEAYRSLLHDRSCAISQDQRIELEHVVNAYNDGGTDAFRRAWAEMKVVP